MRLQASISILLCVFCWFNISAQESDLRELPGTYRNPTAIEALKTAHDLNQLKGADRANMVNNLIAQHTLLMNTPSLKSFTGMEARLYAYGKLASAFQERTTGEMRLMLYPFTKAIKTGKIAPVDEAPASLSIFTNDLNKILFNVDGWWDQTNKVKVPQFFDKFPMVDSTADYMEIRARNQNFRILQMNNNPIFIPLTRKEFLQFLLAEETQQMEEAQKIVNDNQERAKKLKADNEEYLKIYKNNSVIWQKNVDRAKEKIKQYKQDISQMTPEQATMGAYINYNKSGGYYEQLAPAGRRDGKALYKVNPDYFDKSKSRSIPQLIVVTYWYHDQFCPKWVQSYIRQLFDEIDYAQLRKEIK